MHKYIFIIILILLTNCQRNPVIKTHGVAFLDKKQATITVNKANKNVGTGLVGAPACGDVMKLQISVDENGIIMESKFKTFGCGSAIASSSFATEWIKGKHINDASLLNNKEISKYLKLPPVKLHCSMLAEDAIKKAINNYKGKNK